MSEDKRLRAAFVALCRYLAVESEKQFTTKNGYVVEFIHTGHSQEHINRYGTTTDLSMKIVRQYEIDGIYNELREAHDRIIDLTKEVEMIKSQLKKKKTRKVE